MSTESFKYTDAKDMKVNLQVKDPTIAQRLDGVEDKVSEIQEVLAVLLAIARRDHPDLVADWPVEEVDDDGRC